MVELSLMSSFGMNREMGPGNRGMNTRSELRDGLDEAMYIRGTLLKEKFQKFQ